MKHTIITTAMNGITFTTGKLISMIGWVYRDNNTHVAIQLTLFWLAMFAVIMLGRYLMAGLIAIAVLGSIAIYMRHHAQKSRDTASASDSFA